MDDFFKKIYAEITNIKENTFLEEMHMISDWGDVQRDIDIITKHISDKIKRKIKFDFQISTDKRYFYSLNIEELGAEDCDVVLRVVSDDKYIGFQEFKNIFLSGRFRQILMRRIKEPRYDCFAPAILKMV